VGLIVDGMNVIGARPDGWWRDRPRARLGLVEALSRTSCAQEAGWCLVVFDGRPGPGERGGTNGTVEVRFAPGGPNAADDLIVQLLEDCEDPAQHLVVTSDRALSSRVRRLGARVEGSAAFRDRLGLDDAG
jgi:predicted RNA-binding protein with PIN domain